MLKKVSQDGGRKPPSARQAFFEMLDRVYRKNYERDISLRKIERGDRESAIAANERFRKRMARDNVSPFRSRKLLKARLAIVYALSAPDFAFTASATEQKATSRSSATDAPSTPNKTRALRAFEIADPRVTFWVRALFPEVSRQTASRYSIIITYFKIRGKKLLPSKVYRKLGYHSLHGWQDIARRALTARKG
jgi:hypothetical protein